MARSMLALGTLMALAAMTAARRRAFMSGLPPPSRAAIVTSLAALVNIAPRLASVAPFLRLMVAHRECPLMGPFLVAQRPRAPSSGVPASRKGGESKHGLRPRRACHDRAVSTPAD